MPLFRILTLKLNIPHCLPDCYRYICVVLWWIRRITPDQRRISHGVNALLFLEIIIRIQHQRVYTELVLCIIKLGTTDTFPITQTIFWFSVTAAIKLHFSTHRHIVVLIKSYPTARPAPKPYHFCHRLYIYPPMPFTISENVALKVT